MKIQNEPDNASFLNLDEILCEIREEKEGKEIVEFFLDRYGKLLEGMGSDYEFKMVNKAKKYIS